MTKPSSITCLSIFVFSLTISGCELAPNTAKDEAITPVQSAHWIREEQLPQIQEGKTAYLPLYDGFMSMAARLYLINQAKYHLDLQYYIWKDDYIGNMILSQLLKAADRGVKVRVQIDDQNGTQLDDKLLALAQHPNFEVRLFNPYKFRQLRALDYGFRMKYINPRMHNKLIIADGTAAVTGGRNISSEYFDASKDFQFSDVDIFFAGKPAHDANQTFIKFWNDDLSYDIRQVLNDSGNPQLLKRLRTEFKEDEVDKNELKRRVGIAEQQIDEQLRKHPIKWGNAYFVADAPSKARRSAQNGDYIAKYLKI